MAMDNVLYYHLDFQTRIPYGNIEPYLYDGNMLSIYNLYMKSDTYKTIKTEAQESIREKYIYLRKFLEPEEIVCCKEKADLQFIQKWSSQQRKQYYDNNSERIKQQSKNYYDKHNEKVTCECGSIVQKNCLTKHKKTKQHQEFISKF